MLRADIWYQIQADCRDRAIGMHPGMRQALQAILRSQGRARGAKTGASTVVVAVAVSLHSSRSVPRADIWHQFWVDCREWAIGMYPGMLQALQAILLSQGRARGAKSCAATVAVAVAFSLRSRR